ncbi:MAG TPA: hypothetical protein VGM10_02605 [Actinocrinis sp.]|jgi:hypothetical protein
MRSAPLWLKRLREHPDLAATGFRLLPAEVVKPALRKRRTRSGPVRIGTSGILPGNLRGIGLILYPRDPDRLYARFADDAHDDVTVSVQAPTSVTVGELPLVEVPIGTTVEALADFGARYIQPGRTLPEPPGPFGGIDLRSPLERVRCHHEKFRRFRIPLGTIPTKPGRQEPDDALEDVVGIERRLILNGFLAMYQWCLMTGTYQTEDGEHFRTPYTSMDTAYSRSLVSLEGRLSELGCHLTLEIDYPPEPDTRNVRALRTRLLEQRPDIDQLPDDLPYDALGAVAAMGLKLLPLADRHAWAAKGDPDGLLSLYFHIKGNDLLSEQEARTRIRELVTPYADSPHKAVRAVVVAFAERYGFNDLRFR